RRGRTTCASWRILSRRSLVRLRRDREPTNVRFSMKKPELYESRRKKQSFWDQPHDEGSSGGREGRAGAHARVAVILRENCRGLRFAAARRSDTMAVLSPCPARERSPPIVCIFRRASATRTSPAAATAPRHLRGGRSSGPRSTRSRFHSVFSTDCIGI